jgi:hypothetical protein
MGKAKSRGTRRAAVKSAAAKKPTPQGGRRATAAAKREPSAGAQGPGMMSLPIQSPPAAREYLRALVGRQGRPAGPGEGAASGKKTKKDEQVGDYFVQLATFHVLPNRRA